MTRPQKSMDGFIPRRSGSPLNRYQVLSRQHSLKDPSHRGLNRTSVRTVDGVKPGNPVASDASTLEQSHEYGLKKSDIDETLRELDDNPPVQKKRTKGMSKFRPRNLRRVIKLTIILFVIAGVLATARGGSFASFEVTDASGFAVSTDRPDWSVVPVMKSPSDHW